MTYDGTLGLATPSQARCLRHGLGVAGGGKAVRPAELFILAWVAWAVSWAAASFWYRPAIKREAGARVWLYRVTIVVGAVLLNYRVSHWLQAPRLWHVGYNGAYALVGVTVAGILFAWWARIYLGSLWSGAVTLKNDHRVIETGPYRLVRHPIYTGLLVATFATAAALATWPAVLGAALIAGGVWIKAGIEERLLSAELGDYAGYQRRVPMLVPGWGFWQG
jgi:protein-S-isoprenylcysteine O-methyltransferase Ste14